MKTKIPTIQQYFERLNGYLDETSRLDPNFKWSKKTGQDVLTLLGFESWLKINSNDSGDNFSEIWLHPRGLYALTSHSNEFHIVAMTADYTSNWMKSNRTSSSFAIEHGYSVKDMEVEVGSFDMLEDLVSSRQTLRDVIPLKDWTLQTITQLETRVLYYGYDKEVTDYNNVSERDSLFNNFRIVLNNFIYSKDDTHSLTNVVKNYIHEFGDERPEPNYNNYHLILSEAVQTILHHDFPDYFNGESSVTISDTQKNQFKVLSEYLHGKSSKSWKEIKDFCDEEKLVAHPLFLCVDLVHNLESRKVVKIQEHVQFLNLQIEKMCSEMTKKEVENLWTKGDVGKNKFYEALVYNHNLLGHYSLCFKKMGARHDLSFITDEMFDFASSQSLPSHYYKTIGDAYLEKNVNSFFNENPYFLNRKNLNADHLKVFLNKLESFPASLYQCLNKIYNENKVRESLFVKNKTVSPRSYRF